MRWLWVLGLAGCHGAASPVAMDALDFGVARAGVAAHAKTAFRNLGERDVTLSAFTFGTAAFAGPFDADGLALGQVVVPAQGSVTVGFDYKPSSAAAVDRDTVTARAEDAEVSGALAGHGGTSTLTASSALALGDVPLHGKATQPLVLTNSGTVPATIVSLGFTPASVALVVSALPDHFTLKAGETRTVPVAAQVRGRGPLSGELVIATDIPAQATLTVPVTANGLTSRFAECHPGTTGGAALPACTPASTAPDDSSDVGLLHDAVDLGVFSGSTAAVQRRVHLDATGNAPTTVEVQLTGDSQRACGQPSNFSVALTGPDGAALLGAPVVLPPSGGSGLDVDVGYQLSQRCGNAATDALTLTLHKQDLSGDDPETVVVTFTAHVQ